jgi:thousand and one amino acid protein kinase
LLGSGGEGGVYLAKQSNGGSVNEVALKLQRSIKDSEKSFLENIIHYQNTYENPNSHQYYPSYIIRIYEIILWNNTFIIVMELGKSNLYDYLKNNRTIQLREKGIICSE